MSTTHINFTDIIPEDLGLTVRLNPASIKHGTPFVYVTLGPLTLTLTDAEEAEQIAAAFTKGARLVREGQAAIDGAAQS